MTKNNCRFLLLSISTILIFILDLKVGSISITFIDIFGSFSGKEIKESTQDIILNIRLPKAIIAIFIGAGVSLCGLLMQTLFRNPLADTSILGISGGSGLGVGILVMASSFSTGFFALNNSNSYWTMILASVLGAIVMLSIISVVIVWLNDIISVLLIGVMLGFLTSSIISILQYFSDPNSVKNFLTWTFGNINNITWEQLHYIIPISLVGIIAVFFMPKYLNLLLLGDAYARSLGLNIRKIRLIIIIITAIIIGTLTAFTGPIGFIGIAIPHFARIIFRTSNHKILIPSTILLGMLVMLCCDILTYLPGNGIRLPINAITALVGAPVIISIIINRRRQKSIFS